MAYNLTTRTPLPRREGVGTIRATAVGFTNQTTIVLGFLLYPYDVKLGTDIDDADLLIVRGDMKASSKPTIRMKSKPFGKIDNGNIVNCRNRIVDLADDLIEECAARFENVMHPSISFKYMVSTQFPLQYNIVPSWIRNWLLRTSELDTDLSQHLANEAARRSLVDAFSLLGFSLRRKSAPTLHITHDIDSEGGLRNACGLKDIENALGIRSTWFLPSDEYDIDQNIARELGQGSTIGSHDIKHDGKLIHIKSHDELVYRLRKSKLQLESLFDQEVICFRSPLMQFSKRIVNALHDAGYRADYSLPCWEPVYPTTMSGFGIESIQPFQIDGILEFPLTLFQDHQLLNVMRMSTSEAVKFLLRQARMIHMLHGDIVLSVHPDYAFSRDLSEYRRLLSSLIELQREEVEGNSPPDSLSSQSFASEFSA